MNVQALQESLTEMQLGRVDFPFPFDAVYVYLSDLDAEGPFLMVSDRRELEPEDGYLLRSFLNSMDLEPDEELCNSVAAVADGASKMAKELTREVA